MQRGGRPVRVINRLLAVMIGLLLSLTCGCGVRGTVRDGGDYPESLDNGLVRLVMVDFGPTTKTAGGMKGIGSRTRDPVCGWSHGMVREIGRGDSSNLDLSDFVEGEDATFVLAVGPAGKGYEIILTLGDPEGDRGPVDIETRGRDVASGVRTRAGRPRQVRFSIDAPDRRLPFRIRAQRCRLFALASLAVYGPPGARLLSLAQTGPRDVRPFVPHPDSLGTLGPESDSRRLLEVFCRFLVEQEPVEGGFSPNGIWYQNAYPIRTLLAASHLLDHPEWREDAFRVLDRFVSDQLPDGRWRSSYFGRAECGEKVLQDATSSNLADIGSMTNALAVAASMADPERRDRYLTAARHYADDVALPDQRADGSFPNRLYDGIDFAHPYSVATATQGTSLAALALATGEPRYRMAAEKAGRWLAERTLESGMMILHPHNSPEPRLVRARDFGDTFYLAEALVWIHRVSQDSLTTAAVGEALRRHLWGEAGLLESTIHGYWWEPPGVWNASKTGGLLEILAWARRDRPGEPMERWIHLAQGWLADPLLRQRIGATSLSFMPNGEFSLVATGFAGVGLAAVTEFDAIFPVVAPARTDTTRTR